MTVIDTNAIIRFLTRDDESQFEAARALLAREACYIPVTVTLEAVWMLENVYQHTPSDIARGLRKTAGLPDVTMDRIDRIDKALRWYEDGFDFADALHRASAPKDVEALATFDQAFIDRASDTNACPIVPPADVRTSNTQRI